MNNQTEETNLLTELHEMIADIIDIDKEMIDHDTHFINELGVDSLLALEVLVALERKYKIKLSEEELRQMYSLRKVYELVNSYVNPNNSIGKGT